MAFTGFLSANTYSVIVVNSYDKQSRFLTFEVRTYTDNTKQDILTTNPYEIAAPENMYDSVKNKDQTTVPTSPSEGDKWLIGAATEPPFEGMEGCVARWIDGNWQLTNCAEDHTVYVEDESKYYTRKDGAWVEDPDAVCVTTFDTNWGSSNWDAENENLLKALYDYVKAKPEYAGVVDV